MQTWDTWDLWRALVVEKVADSFSNAYWQNWMKQTQVGFEYLKKIKKKNLPNEFSTCYVCLNSLRFPLSFLRV